MNFPENTPLKLYEVRAFTLSFICDLLIWTNYHICLSPLAFKFDLLHYRKLNLGWLTRWNLKRLSCRVKYRMETSSVFKLNFPTKS
jgi:hypothetical protein